MTDQVRSARIQSSRTRGSGHRGSWSLNTPRPRGGRPATLRQSAATRYVDLLSERVAGKPGEDSRRSCTREYRCRSTARVSSRRKARRSRPTRRWYPRACSKNGTPGSTFSPHASSTAGRAMGLIALQSQEQLGRSAHGVIVLEQDHAARCGGWGDGCGCRRKRMRAPSALAKPRQTAAVSGFVCRSCHLE